METVDKSKDSSLAERVMREIMQLCVTGECATAR